MTKYTRRSITDIYGFDILTGKYVGSQLSFDLEQKQKQRQEEFSKKEVIDGKVYVEGLGYVSI